ncbi:dihydrolipoamide acetyltransferase family protein [Kribbella sp. CA-253562]|uniref:dihydrolipoamide acetyltransferase family protein n=1 Tax=Kribbella sp. CA-253562 TaxID=3239942 RepID=UPI003D91AC4E
MAEILRMPEVAANTTEAILESWNVELNTAYAAGDAIVTVETEKAVVDVEAEADGVLLRLLVDAGTTVPVGTPIAVWGAADEPPASVDALVASLGGAAVAPPAVAVTETSSADGAAPPAPPGAPDGGAAAGAEAAASSAPGERIFASPLARRRAQELGVDLRAVRGSSPGGRIRRRDVEAAAEAAAKVEAPVTSTPEPIEPERVAAANYVDIPNTRMRAAIARRLTESKQQIPHFYLRAGARVDALLDLRRQLNADQDVKISINDLLVKAIAAAHTAVPAMNVQWNDTSIRHFSTVDIAVAVATDNGLLTPVVRNADSLSISRVAATTKDLVARAKDRRLRQDELEGGSISITNLGMYGTEDFAAIINPPQAAILAVGAIRPEPVADDGAVAVASVLRLTLAVDHRPVDGATAAEWMKAYVDLLEHPVRILV